MNLALWFLFLLTVPIYIFPSGLPQPADMILVLTGFIVISRLKLRIHGAWKATLKYALAFAGYATLVNCIWAMIMGDIDFLRPPLFYVYNVFAMIIALHLCSVYQERFWKWTLYGCLGTVALVLIMYLVQGDMTGRFTGLFNNPNQLGYFSVLVTSVIYICLDRLRHSGFYKALTLFLGTFMAALSLSRAALAAMSLMIIIVALLDVFRRKSLSVPVVIAILAALILPVAPDLPVIQRVEARIMLRKGDESLEGRGYDRITKYPSMVLLGAGEGANWRFSETGRSIELHSTPGTVLFSYGLPGSVIFLGLIISIIRRSRLEISSLLLPVMVYGLTHQGLRFTLFWIFLAMLLDGTSAIAAKDRLSAEKIDSASLEKQIVG